MVKSNRASTQKQLARNHQDYCLAGIVNDIKTCQQGHIPLNENADYRISFSVKKFPQIEKKTTVYGKLWIAVISGWWSYGKLSLLFFTCLKFSTNNTVGFLIINPFTEKLFLIIIGMWWIEIWLKMLSSIEISILVQVLQNSTCSHLTVNISQ